MGIKTGNNNISNLYLGSSQVSKAYLGAVQVWPSVGPEPVVGSVITYTTYDGNIMYPNTSKTWDANIVSNVYEDGFGKLGFDGSLTSVVRYAYSTGVNTGHYDNLKSIYIPEGVTTINSKAFAYSKIVYVSLPSTLTKINVQVFLGCKNLTEVEIPENVTEIWNQAFQYCTSLKKITSHNTTAPTLKNNDVFGFLPSRGTLYIPSGSNYSSWTTALPSGWTVVEF